MNNYTASFDIWSDYFNFRNYKQKLWYALIIFILKRSREEVGREIIPIASHFRLRYESARPKKWSSRRIP